MHKLILWDIDGTLINSGGVSGECMRAAMQQVYGASSKQERHQYAGKTDSQIILETFPDQNPTTLLANLDHFTEIYLAELNRQQNAWHERGRVLPGTHAILERLKAEPLVQSALTGNLAAVAEWKLAQSGLLQWFHLAVGAFGSDHQERTRLPAIAAARATAYYGYSFHASNVIIIGDTPNDIACGKAFGARTVAVASGPYSVQDLTMHRPDAVLPSLLDTEAVVWAVLG